VAGIAAAICVDSFTVGMSPAWLAVAFVFVANMLLQEALLRRRNEARNVRRLALLHRLNADTHGEVSRHETEFGELGNSHVVTGGEAVSASLRLTPVADAVDTPAFRVAQPRYDRAPAVARNSGVLAARSDSEANRVRRPKQALDRSGVTLIVDNVVSELTLVELLDFDIDFGAGMLFGAARQAGIDTEPAPMEHCGVV